MRTMSALSMATAVPLPMAMPELASTSAGASFTPSGDTLPQVGRRRKSVAIEPMTCAPNAFVTGDGLRVLAPGESFAGRWGIQPGELA